MRLDSRVVGGCILLAATAWSAPAAAQMSANDKAAFKDNAGTYSTACGKAGSARAIIAPDSITIEVGSKRRKGKAEMAAASSFGKAGPPKGYEDFHLELFSGVGNLYVMKGKAGTYVVFPERAELEKHFGKGSLAGRFKRCA